MNEAMHLTIKFLVVILWMMRVVSFDELRLSIIIAPEEENDFYFDFLQSFSHAAAVGGESKLSFEIIVVQTSCQIVDYKGSHTPYSQSDAWHEMPAAASLPSTKEFASVTWRFITVDRQQYAVTKGSLWETSARNIGAVRARGKFLLFPRPDAMVPDGIVQWLVEHTFDDRAVIYAAACNQDLTADHNRCVSSNATTCTISRKVRALPSTDKARSLHDMRAFTLFPRELFMSARGYLEVPTTQALPLEVPTTPALPPQPAFQTSQIPRPSRDWQLRFYNRLSATHIGHLEEAFAQHLDSLQRDAVPWRLLSEPVWCSSLPPNNAKSRRTRAAREFAQLWNAGGRHVEEILKRYPNSASFGLQGEVLAESRAANMVDKGFAPEAAATLQRHYGAFAHFPQHLAPFDSEYVTDFVGTRTLYAYDCQDWGRYRRSAHSLPPALPPSHPPSLPLCHCLCLSARFSFSPSPPPLPSPSLLSDTSARAQGTI